GQDPDAEPDAHWMPFLRRQSPAAVDVAKRTAIRWLEARALMTFTDDADAPVLGQPLASLAHVLHTAAALVTWRADVRDEPTAVGGAFVLPADVVLHDDIDGDAGLHTLVFRSLHREGAWVAALLDPDGCARSTQPPVLAPNVGALRPDPEGLARQAYSSSVVATAAHAPGGDVEQAVTTYGTDDGLWLLQGRVGRQREASLQRLGGEDVLAVARHLLALHRDPGP
ncbi:MAG: hypothetical protein ACRDU8_05395, partial [Egibacteraceae bacterium]